MKKTVYAYNQKEAMNECRAKYPFLVPKWDIGSDETMEDVC